MDWCRAMLKRIWWNGADNTHPYSHGEIVRRWNVLVQIYGKTNMVKWCTEYTPMFIWRNGDMVKWCGEGNTKVKQWNGETIILNFNRHRFLGTHLWWVPIALLHFIGCCITRRGKICLWIKPRWSSKQPMSRPNALWRHTPLLFSNWFLLFILLLITLTTTNTGGRRPILHLTDSCHCSVLLYWRYN